MTKFTDDNPVRLSFWCANVIWKCFVKSLFVPLLLRLHDRCSSPQKPVLFDCFHKESWLEHIQKTCLKSSWCTHYVVDGRLPWMMYAWCYVELTVFFPSLVLLPLITFSLLLFQCCVMHLFQFCFLKYTKEVVSCYMCTLRWYDCIFLRMYLRQ